MRPEKNPGLKAQIDAYAIEKWDLPTSLKPYKITSCHQYDVRKDSPFTLYVDGRAPDVLVNLLAGEFKRNKQGRGRRLRLYHGNPETGQHWGDVSVGYISRSVGRIKAPLIVRKGEAGGYALGASHIVKVALDWNGKVLYEHPQFRECEHGSHVCNPKQAA